MSTAEHYRTPFSLRVGRPWRRWQAAKLATGYTPLPGRWATGILLTIISTVITYFIIRGRADNWDPHRQFRLKLALTLSLGCLAVRSRWKLSKRTQCASTVIIGVLALYFIVLGWNGFSDCVGSQVPWITRIYYGLLLMSGGTIESCVPTTLTIQLAHIGGLAVLFTAVFAEMFSSPITRIFAGWAHHVVLVAGPDEGSLPVVRSLTA